MTATVRRTAPVPAGRWYHEDNGFSTRAAMDAAHRPLIDRALGLLPPAGPGRVLDLGCGNGALVGKLARRRPGLIPAGVDLCAEAVARARRLLPAFAGEFAVRSLYDPACFPDDRPPNTVTLLMIGRLVEARPEVAADVLGRVRNNTTWLVLYAYEDYLRAVGPFAELTARLDLTGLSPLRAATVTLAVVPGARV